MFFLVGDNQDRSNPATTLGVDILVTKDGSTLELTGGVDEFVILTTGLDLAVVTLVLVLEEGVDDDVLAIVDLDILFFDLGGLLAQEVIDLVSDLGDKVANN